MFLVVSTFLLQDAYALGGAIHDQQSCEAIGGAWSGKCTITSLFIDSGEGLLVDKIELVNAGGITNLGTVTNQGTITNAGVIQNDPGGTINNTDTITNIGLGNITSYGNIINAGTINNNDLGLIHLNSTCTLSNSGVINNSETLTNNGGRIDNTGAITIFNGATINNHGIMINQLGGSITSKYGATLINTATIDTPGIVSNEGTISIFSSGIVGNPGNIVNIGTITNAGAVSNPGSITNQCGAVYYGNPPSGNPINYIACVFLAIDNASVAEGNCGSKTLTFTVTRSGDTTVPATVDYAVVDKTATAATSDYISASGTIGFAGNEVAKAIGVVVNGDAVLEPDETFGVNLANCVGCSIAVGQGVGSILDDDTCNPAPASCTAPEVRVCEISFNYAGSGAITLFDDMIKANIAAPEYISASPVVKAAAWVMGGSPSVRVRFAAVSSLSSAQIWAEGGLGGLGSSASPITVTFAGGFGQADFPVKSPPGAIVRDVFTWDWKQRVGAATADMGITGSHLLYVVLATPQAPQATPWVGTLEVAARVVQGERTAVGATRKIWRRFYYSAGGQYDTIGGASQYTGALSQAFNLTLWLTNYNTSGIGVVNCYDMGKSVVVFSNALGAGAEYTFTFPFGYLNLVKPIGRGWTNNPFYDSGVGSPNPVVDGDWSSSDGRTSFSNHAFARLASRIFDASGGLVDTDSDPDTLPPGAPLALEGRYGWPTYRPRVIDDIPVSVPGIPTVYPFVVN